MAIRVTSDVIRTLHVVQLFSTDIKYQSQSFNCKNNFQEMSTVNKFKHTSTNLPKDSISSKKLAKEAVEQTQKQESNKLTNYALVHKVHPSDRPLRNNVPEREKCTELDDILAKWNIYKPKK
ncbi:hypothetical protein K0M31_012224 [Melipona bicolor]|uniref:Uncharacterized protein n=1 Tax=Melipona bicolor TaxID=60889 RepID=A0AA40FKC8_9HYME|nr:hypothetical protein K0M31_012224 [Melipona bicolor]